MRRGRTWRKLTIAARGQPARAAVWTLGVILGLAAAAAYGVALWRAPGWMHATTAQDAYNARVLVISVGGAIVVGTGLLYTARNYRLSRRGQVTDRFTVALERLGSTELYVRIGGVHALEHVMRDSAEHHNDVIEVLTEFINDRAPRRVRQLGRQVWMHPVTGSVPDLPTRPTPDIQAALTALGHRPHRPERQAIALGELHLAAANLPAANLPAANLPGAQLAVANLAGAWLEGADLTGAWLTGAWLEGANLTRAKVAHPHVARRCQPRRRAARRRQPHPRATHRRQPHRRRARRRQPHRRQPHRRQPHRRRAQPRRPHRRQPRRRRPHQGVAQRRHLAAGGGGAGGLGTRCRRAAEAIQHRPGRPRGQELNSHATGQFISNIRRVPECAGGRLPCGSGLDQGLRSWTASRRVVLIFPQLL